MMQYAMDLEPAPLNRPAVLVAIARQIGERGACLAAVRLSEGIRPGVVQLPTGAWYDPADPDDDKPLCVHGNPNVLTLDKGTSKLTQGCSAHTALVEVELFKGELPRVTAFDPPQFVQR